LSHAIGRAEPGALSKGNIACQEGREELMVLSAELQAGGIRLELLTGPLTCIYDPSGGGSMLFALLADAA
jgi:hypothetical protein